MEKTTVYLTGDQKRALEAAARAAGRSEARLIREGIDAVTGTHRVAEATTALEGGRPPGSDAGPDGAPRRPRWIGRDELVRLLARPADAGLRTDLRRLAPGTTDDEPTR